MLHLQFSKLKNPASGWVFLLLLLVSDLHGNPARTSNPESAQVAKTAGCPTVHHVVECT
jgi:hypothetical protein